MGLRQLGQEQRDRGGLRKLCEEEGNKASSFYGCKRRDIGSKAAPNRRVTAEIYVIRIFNFNTMFLPNELEFVTRKVQICKGTYYHLDHHRGHIIQNKYKVSLSVEDQKAVMSRHREKNHHISNGDLNKEFGNDENVERVIVNLSAIPGVKMKDVVDQEAPRRKEHRRVPSTIAIEEVKATNGVPKPSDALSGELWEVKKERIRKLSPYGKVSDVWYEIKGLKDEYQSSFRRKSCDFGVEIVRRMKLLYETYRIYKLPSMNGYRKPTTNASTRLSSYTSTLTIFSKRKSPTGWSSFTLPISHHLCSHV
ncbi:Phosphatidylinositol 4-kinase beta 1 [Dendrobium catenatum]|uniref:Phosphatidylinositol 4-kinase beta 1 n=1 Tax=Dendrobium catenatum TaxID=906689 RepID=A0A2I0W9B5_9ASPA|nr:Phosphatidylinositol 4-kinase beta 1 [Dendrobium catenatum]